VYPTLRGLTNDVPLSKREGSLTIRNSSVHRSDKPLSFGEGRGGEVENLRGLQDLGGLARFKVSGTSERYKKGFRLFSERSDMVSEVPKTSEVLKTSEV
jgi:hypothetical protein